MLGVILALGSAICWSIEPSFYVLGMRNTPPLLANAIRTSSAGIFSLFLVILWEDFLGQPFDWVQVAFLIGITFVGMGFGDWLYFKCLESTDVAFVVGLTNAYPLFVAFFTILFGTETLTLLTILASIIIVSGVLLVSKVQKTGTTQIINTHSHTSEPLWRKHGTPTTLAILVAFTWAITIFGLGFILQYFTALSANSIRISAVGCLLFLAFFISPPANHRDQKTSKSSLAFLGGGGILGLGIGSWMMLRAIQLLGAARSAALLSVSPFFSALIAILVLREKPTLQRLGGILLVCLGVCLMALA